MSPRHSDLVTEHVDLAIRLGEVVGDQLVVRRLGTIEQVLFSAPSYLALHGHPLQPVDLIEQGAGFSGVFGGEAASGVAMNLLVK